MEFTPWTLEDILAHLERYAITVCLRGGESVIVAPRCTPTAVLAAVYPSLKAQRVEVMAHFASLAAKTTTPSAAATSVAATPVAPPAPSVPVEPLHLRRRRVFVAVLTRSLSERGRPRAVWYLAGPVPVVYRSSRKLPADTRYVCVEGDSQWTELPLV